MKISIIITTKNEEFNISRLLKSMPISKNEIEVIIVDAGSTDKTCEIANDTEISDTWYKELTTSIKQYDIVAGYSPDPEGRHLPRVPIYVNGQDITYPTCNIAYKREIFEKVGYFREEMITAEDIELNYRCVQAGYIIFYNPKMMVNHYQRTTRLGFAKQAFWNGYGRRQLNRIHPELKHMHQHGAGLKNLVRLGIGFLGLNLGRLFK